MSPAACPSHDDSTAGHCRREAHDGFIADHKRFNGVTVVPAVTNIIHQTQQRAGPMSLWINWWNAIWRLRPAFCRLQTFLWFATAVAGFTVRTDMLGVTSIVRALNLDARQRQVRPGRRRHQGPQVRPQNAGGQTAASAVRIKNQTRGNYWALPAGGKTAPLFPPPLLPPAPPPGHPLRAGGGPTPPPAPRRQ